jgi:hypothetical protein
MLCKSASSGPSPMYCSFWTAVPRQDRSSSGITDGGKTELIAPCGHETTAEGPGPESFTHALTKELSRMSGFEDGFSIAELHERVLSRIVRCGQDLVARTPVYVRLNGKAHRSSIRLKVLDYNRSRGQQVGAALQENWARLKTKSIKRKRV